MPDGCFSLPLFLATLQYVQGLPPNKIFTISFPFLGKAFIFNGFSFLVYSLSRFTVRIRLRHGYQPNISRFLPTHEPIIDQETFDNVQRIRGRVKRYPDGWGEAHPLIGLMYCAGCGGKMYVHRVNNGKRVPMYVCGNYAKQPV